MSAPEPAEAAPARPKAASRAWPIAVAIAIASLALILGGVFGVRTLAEPPVLDFGSGAKISYEGVTEDDAKRLGDGLREIGYFGDAPAEVRLVGVGKTRVIRCFVDPAAGSDPKIVAGFISIRRTIALDTFPGTPVTIELLEPNGATLKTLPGPALAKVEDVPGQRVVYEPSASEQDARRLSAHLLSEGFFNPESPQDVGLSRQAGAAVVAIAVEEGKWDDPEVVESAEALRGKMVEAGVFPDAPVKLELCDESFAPRKTVGPPL